MLPFFRIVAILEGISYLLLFAIGMPLKYWAGLTEPNKFIGYAHGFLFMAYVVLAIVLGMERNWGVKKYFWVLLASLLPFGTFYLDREYLSKLDAGNLG